MVPLRLRGAKLWLKALWWELLGPRARKHMSDLQPECSAQEAQYSTRVSGDLGLPLLFILFADSNIDFYPTCFCESFC